MFSYLFYKSYFHFKKNKIKNKKIFSYEGLKTCCYVTDIYDGDTCRVVFNHNGEINKWTIRMNGYDTPEIRPSRKLENREEIKKKAIESRDYLKSLIMNENQLVYLHCGDFDKYGRPLAIIYKDNININEMLVKDGYAKEYDGGTKDAW